MGRAVDTILAFNTQAGAGAFPQALAATPGDSLVVRASKGEAAARIMALITGGTAGSKYRVSSPLMHDNVTGLTFAPAEMPAQFTVPPDTSVEVQQQDTLVVSGSCTGATTITMGIVIDYDDLRGTAAELYRWADIKPDIRYLKSVEIDLNAIAVGAWTDTPLTTTEDQLHADKSYAVLGWTVNQSVDILGIKGVATGNLRMCGPGAATTVDVAEYFVHMSERHGRPYIPVIQANDRRAISVSAANHAAIAGAAAQAYIWVAELKSKK
jgi:hypothetical protein